MKEQIESGLTIVNPDTSGDLFGKSEEGAVNLDYVPNNDPAIYFGYTDLGNSNPTGAWIARDAVFGTYDTEDVGYTNLTINFGEDRGSQITGQFTFTPRRWNAVVDYRAEFKSSGDLVYTKDNGEEVSVHDVIQDLQARIAKLEESING